MSSPTPNAFSAWSFLIDENMPRPLAPALQSQGYLAQDTRDVGLRGHPDTEVWAYAQTHGQTVVTYDREFGNILVYPKPHAGILVGDRIDHLAPPTQIRIILDALTSISGQSLTNALVVVSPGRVRIHR